jgi:hypothetical protein
MKKIDYEIDGINVTNEIIRGENWSTNSEYDVFQEADNVRSCKATPV